MEMMIEVQDLTKYYGPHLAVSRLDFQVAAGEIVGFLGPNGAGKTTTLKILAGFLAPSAGTARINGHDCVTDSLAVRRSLGYVPENVAIYPDLTVTQFLRFATRAKGIAAKAETAKLTGWWRPAAWKRSGANWWRPCPRGSASGWGWPRP